MKSSPVIKHSIGIDGRRTSISLEDVFWTALKEIAKERGKTLSQLVTSINANRKFANLSSALRIFVVRHYMAQSAQYHEMFEQREITIQ